VQTCAFVSVIQGLILNEVLGGLTQSLLANIVAVPSNITDGVLPGSQPSILTVHNQLPI
jgi:hypothetical protein